LRRVYRPRSAAFFVYLNPFADIVTITVLMATVFAAHSLMQMVFAVKVRSLKGWYWRPDCW
jgi:uncharacterized membrane protein HdeD (DUF308 family)